MDTKKIVDFWKDAETAIADLFGQEVWESYYATNNTAKVVAVIPFILGNENPDRLAYASLIQLWGAKKAKTFSSLRGAKDHRDRLLTLPIFSTYKYEELSGAELVAFSALAYRAYKDFEFDLKLGKYMDQPAVGTLQDAKDAINKLEVMIASDTTGTSALFDTALPAIGGTIGGSNSVSTLSFW